jgi:hypothetical protein
MIASVLLHNSGFASFKATRATRARVIGLRALSSGPKSAAPKSNIDEVDNILPVRGDKDADCILGLSHVSSCFYGSIYVCLSLILSISNV